MHTTGDARQVKAHQRRTWEGLATGCRRWAATFEAGARPVTDALLDLARVGDGHWVLDVATGVGEPALAAARRVGPQGKVVGLDLSKRMVTAAEERARAAGLAAVAAFHEVDAEALQAWPEKSYDVALCRFGLMYLPQLPLALRGIHRVLTTGSAFAAAVWGRPDKVPLFSIGERVAERMLALPAPPPGTPTAYGLARPGDLEQALSSAGFRAITGERMTIVFELESADAYAELVRDTAPIALAVAGQPEERQEQIWRAVADEVRPLAGADGKVAFTCEVTCVGALRG